MKNNFEEELNKLRELSDKIKSPEASLEDSLKYYEEGMKAYKNCAESLDKAKQKIEMYNFENGTVEEL